MAADYNDDDWLNAVLKIDPSGPCLVLKLRAKKKICLVEVQGFTSEAEELGLRLPGGFRKMLFGEGALIPEEMKSDVEHMNRLNFRWGCNVPLRVGEETEIVIPASSTGKDRAVLTLAYEFPRFFGLFKGRNGLYARTSK